MTTPDTSQTDASVLPALADFPFPTALVVTGTVTGSPVTDIGVLHEAGDVDEIFPLASVTKPIVAWSALVAVDRGLLDLEAPAGPPAPDGATIAHLLSHSSGIAVDSDERLAAPGTRRIYSNRGIEILGERLEEATGTPLETWVETTVLEPLGMASVLIPGSPAHSGEGSARDLSLFARELAAPRLVSSALAERARTPVLPGLDGVLPGYGRQAPNPFGLGVEVRGNKSPHWTGKGNSPRTFGHFGQSGSFIWVDPVAGRQAAFLGAEPFGPVHRRTWPALGDQILALQTPSPA
ncbi:serine hydrolase [Actinomyces sp. oral taxon 170]|uniref:serine hydrolase domain-containing protein n=1 Tax=Actinomyces sp. oral taxon 170 TaxID=712117 RepID=UPI000205DB80|nr:serine hydrolase domain-containing protein [Actinomyces sp. oral taxon 170]EGF54787.1 beta-lactamase [Actinomyces sp. oral taxon 170 str. F0386]